MGGMYPIIGGAIHRYPRIAARQRSGDCLLEQALQKDFDDPELVQTDPALGSLRTTEHYQQLIKKYFPSSSKN